MGEPALPHPEAGLPPPAEPPLPGAEDAIAAIEMPEPESISRLPEDPVSRAEAHLRGAEYALHEASPSHARVQVELARGWLELARLTGRTSRP